jgi:hypothetical protein
MFSITETTKGKKCLLFDEYRDIIANEFVIVQLIGAVNILVVVVDVLYKEVMIYLLSSNV